MAVVYRDILANLINEQINELERLEQNVAQLVERRRIQEAAFDAENNLYSKLSVLLNINELDRQLSDKRLELIERALAIAKMKRDFENLTMG